MQKRTEVLTYPKLTILIATYIIAYIIFSDGINTQFHDFLIPLGYIGIFITGILYTYGFTSAIATAALLILAGDQNIFLAAIIGGLGAMIGDLTIFKFIKHSVDDEFRNLTKEKAISYIISHIPKKLKKHLAIVIGCLVLSSPLPDEVGVTMLAGLTHIKTFNLAVLSFFFNSLGIFIMLLI